MSYLKIALSAIGIYAIPVAVFTLTSCGGGSGKSYDEAKDTPAGTYREYLSELRTQDRLSFEGLTARLGQWQTVRDSVSAHIRRDTLWRSHTDMRKECLLLHDSIRMEFSRLALSRPRTYKEVLALKEHFSPYAEDGELHRSAQEIQPFFASLDTDPTTGYIRISRFAEQTAAWHTGVAKNNFCRRTARFSPRHSARAYTDTATLPGSSERKMPFSVLSLHA